MEWVWAAMPTSAVGFVRGGLAQGDLEACASGPKGCLKDIAVEILSSGGAAQGRC
jgi:hypothetical protein